MAQLLEEPNVLTYLPRFLPGPRTKAGSVRGQRPRCVFPGYLFFSPPPSPGTWREISGTAGVRRVLLQDGEPGIISDSVIEHLKKRLSEGIREQSARRFHPGQPVVIERGPLAALDAIFERDLDERSRVQILVHLMGRPLRVRIDAEDIRYLAS